MQDRDRSTCQPYLKRHCAAGPDPDVVNIESGADQVRVAIKNRGNRTITDSPDTSSGSICYVQPQPAPDHVNHPWATLAEHGAAWGITWSWRPLFAD